MAHCVKLSKAACGHMFKHYERAKDEFGQYVKFGNTEIDPARTPNNYNLAPDRGISQGEFVRQRCSEVRCLNRKDVNVMCSWVVTMPKDLEPGKTKDFMQATYDFLENRYGKENVVSAYVHLDEVTPHMHFAFVPVTYDAKKDLYKVSACEVVNRTELRVFHKELQAHLEKALECDVNILTGITQEQGGNKSVSELKKLSEQAELLENEKNRLEAKIDAFCDDLFDGVDDDVVIELFKRLPYKKQFQAVLEAEFPDVQYRPQVTNKVFEDYMESFEPSYLRPDVIKSIEQASGVEYEDDFVSYEDDFDF